MHASFSQLLVGGGRVSTDTSGRPPNGKEGLQKELRLPSGKNTANMIIGRFYENCQKKVKFYSQKLKKKCDSRSARLKVVCIFQLFLLGFSISFPLSCILQFILQLKLHAT